MENSAQARVHVPLAFFGGMELGVFFQVSVSPRLQDFLGQFVAELIFERINLFLQLFLKVFHLRVLLDEAS
jgi:hypothetical protein